LDLFRDGEPEMGVTEIANKLGMHKSTIFNIINTLEQDGYLRRNPKTARYSLGLKILQLGYNMYTSFDLRRNLYPYLSEISTKTGETVYLGLLSDEFTEVVYIDALLPSQKMTIRNNIGIRAPVYCTAIGKALLATLPDTDVEKVLMGPLARFTPNTIVAKDLIREELLKIRKRGFAIDDMEHEFGIKCVGIAITNHDHLPLCGVSISGPSLRFSQESIEKYSAMLFELKSRIEGTASQENLG
jgi:IclR family transcriptional regulator, KDG regulon repressor